MLSYWKLMKPESPEPFVIEPISTLEANGFLAEKLEMQIHCGSHIDAPAHFVRGGGGVDQIPLELLIGDTVVLDLTHKKFSEPINADDLERAEEKLQKKGIRIEEGYRVLIATGHHNKTWGTRDYWEKTPYITSDAIEWLLKKKVSAVGYDFWQEGSPSMSCQIHTMFLEKGIPQIEYLAGLEKIKGMKVFLAALPLYIRGASGSPARVIAIIEK